MRAGRADVSRCAASVLAAVNDAENADTAVSNLACVAVKLSTESFSAISCSSSSEVCSKCAAVLSNLCTVPATPHVEATNISTCMHACMAWKIDLL